MEVKVMDPETICELPEPFIFEYSYNSGSNGPLIRDTKKENCLQCIKTPEKKTLIYFNCKHCNNIFCLYHRLPEQHNCILMSTEYQLKKEKGMNML